MTNSKNKKNKRRSQIPAGLPPGTLTYTGLKETGIKPSLSLMIFKVNNTEVFSTEAISVQEALVHLNSLEEGSVAWLNVDGLSDLASIRLIQSSLDLDELAVEDALKFDQRPKFNLFDTHCSFILHMCSLHQQPLKLDSEQIAVMWNNSIVVTFQERHDIADPENGTQQDGVIEGIKSGLRGRCRRVKELETDYIVHAIIDTIIDHYFIVLENFSDLIEAENLRIVLSPDHEFQRLFYIRQQLVQFRRFATPAHEALNELLLPESPFVKDGTRMFFKDISEHAIKASEEITFLKEEITTTIELQLALLAHKSHTAIHFLTVVTSIFIPLTFICSIYGMNFRHMPELEWQYGYFGLLGLMAIGTIAMLLYFRAKRWL